MIALILAFQLATSTTTCTPQPGLVTCSTQYQPAPSESADPNPIIQQMLSPEGVNNFQRGQQQAMQRQSTATAGDGSTPESRRAAAYAQVGDLIAKGNCAGAKRLAQFYNHPDIIADTAKACP